MKCYRCASKTDAHIKLGVALCEECYMDDIDFTGQAIRLIGTCPNCPSIYGRRGWRHRKSVV